MIGVYKGGTLFVMLLSLMACSIDQHDHPRLTTGKQLYDFHCAPCHKEDGRGVFLKGVPPNWNTKLSVWEIIHKTESGNGIKSKMPKFEAMPDGEAAKIAIYLKQLG
jgi:mono/diheme cytochrome c family protein